MVLLFTLRTAAIISGLLFTEYEEDKSDKNDQHQEGTHNIIGYAAAADEITNP